jgi:beta-N-acetylhexosaminidase
MKNALLLFALVLMAATCKKGITPPADTTTPQPPVVAAPKIIKEKKIIQKAPEAQSELAEPDPDPVDLSVSGAGSPSVLGVGGTEAELAKEQQWVDSVFATMSEDERIGQLLMLRAHTNKGAAYEDEVANQIARLRPGGLCFFQGTIERQAEVTNRYQSLCRVPLMVSMDAEYGLGMRLSNAITYPRQMTLGALRDEDLIYQYGQEMARQCRRLGVHISFSPCADVNNNPANPVINDRSFGDDRYNVAAKSARYMLGLQDGGVMACAKHFPGHGDTDVDSHHALPIIAHGLDRLDSLELFPFKNLIKSGVASFMVAHLNIPVFEKSTRPSTLSRNIITGQLRERLGFEGLIFTDAMEMRAVADSFPAGVADVEALKAGNDVVLLPVSPDAAFAAIKKALADSSYNREQFEGSVRRVLRYKHRLGLTAPQRIETAGVKEQINSPKALQLKRDLFQNALTLVRDRDTLAGFGVDVVRRLGKKQAGQLRIATVALGAPQPTIFQKTCALYAPVAVFGTDTAIAEAVGQRLLDTLTKHYDVVLVSHHNTRSKKALNYGLTRSEINFVHQLNATMPTAFTVFGNPYSIAAFDNIAAVMVAFTEDPMAQEAAAQAWFGARDIVGRLPVDVSAKARYRQGRMVKFAHKRLSYDLPEAVGMSSDTLAQLDVLAKELIDGGAAPGCQILVAKDGKVIWHKAYGYHTYEQMVPMTTETLFDLASITKVAATTLGTMRLVDEGQFDMAQPVARFAPFLANSNKKSIVFNELLIHQAGLQAWIPFYKTTIDNNKFPHTRLYRRAQEPGFTIPVAKDLWMRNDYRDSIWQEILESPLRSDKAYKYSDLTMYLTARAIEHTTGKALDAYVTEQFYQPLGMGNTLFNPWQKGWAARCAPTERDDYFRQQIIQGYVHDMGAAMMGGVSGHAGLFGTANDLAILFQMLLDGGKYGGRRYLSEATVNAFTTRQLGSTRRGLGFDMKELDPKATKNMSELAGANTFGHSGFTGNVVWADPDQNLIFVFLSNRTYPTMENNKLINGDYRPKLQSVVYRAMK